MKRTLRLQYVGLRLNVIGEDPVHTFRHGKRELCWSRLGYPRIGSLYEAVQDGENTTLKVKQWPKNPPDDFVIPQEWLDSDAAAQEFLKKRRELAKIKRLTGEIWPEVKPLHARAKKLGIFERQKFADAVARMILTGKFGLAFLLLTSCGKDTSCRIIPVAGTEKPTAAPRCPAGQVVTGISGSVLTCAEVSVLCPTKEN